MGIKCSLFGHSFGDATVEREREEQGSEVVITIREYRTCTRCGETRIVSENKEVTTLETPDDVEAPPAEETADEPEIMDAETDAAVESGPTTDVPPTADDGATVEESQPVETGDDQGGNVAPVTDDAEILEDEESETADREPGEWPQEAEQAEESEEAEPDEGTDQFAYSEDTIDETKTDAEIIDTDSPAEPAEAEAETETEADAGTETPAHTTHEWPSEDEIDTSGEASGVGPGAVTVPDGSFVCEECEFTTPVEQSSLREGDFCPECRRGTLVQVRDAPDN